VLIAPVESPKDGFFMDLYEDQLCCLLDHENSFISLLVEYPIRQNNQHMCLLAPFLYHIHENGNVASLFLQKISSFTEVAEIQINGVYSPEKLLITVTRWCLC
jgi:hypothetical protein